MNWSNKDADGWRRSPPWHIRQSLGVFYIYRTIQINPREARNMYQGCRKTWAEAVAFTAAGNPPREEPVVTAPPDQEVDVAKKKAAVKKSKAGRKPGNGETTVAQLTEEFNALVPRAQKKGIKWARHHTSSFGSRAGAEKQLKKLRDELSA